MIQQKPKLYHTNPFSAVTQTSNVHFVICYVSIPSFTPLH